MKILLDAITQKNRFPASITVNGVTTQLDYGYIFKPQSENDYKDYSPNNLTGVKLITNNYYDIPAKWVNDNGSWGIDFSNSPFSAVEVPDGNYEFGTQYTTIALVKLVNDDTTNIFANDGFVFSKWWYGSFYDHSKVNIISQKKYFVEETNPMQYVTKSDIYYDFVTDSNITQQNKPFILSESLNCYSNIRNIVKDQTLTSSTLQLGNYRASSITSITDGRGRMFLGNGVAEYYGYGSLYWLGMSYTYSNLKGVLYGFAIVKQSLDATQIKELHKQMGF